jgi:hypothetical protein
VDVVERPVVELDELVGLHARVQHVIRRTPPAWADPSVDRAPSGSTPSSRSVGALPT